MAYTAEKAFHLIERAHERGRLAHAFLITGEAGSGKTALASKIISMINPPEESGGMNLFGEAEAAPQAPSLDELEGEALRAPTYGALVAIVAESSVIEVKSRCQEIGAPCTVIGSVAFDSIETPDFCKIAFSANTSTFH